MTAIRKIRIHGFGGKEVLRADDVEPSLPNAAARVASVNPVDFKTGSVSIGDRCAAGAEIFDGVNPSCELAG
jgi:hypothetical protein